LKYIFYNSGFSLFIVYYRPIRAFGILGAILAGSGILAKVATIANVINISTGLSTGFIILGVVAIMMGIFASMIFKRQIFAEKDMRAYLGESHYLKD